VGGSSKNKLKNGGGRKLPTNEDQRGYRWQNFNEIEKGDDVNFKISFSLSTESEDTTVGRRGYHCQGVCEKRPQTCSKSFFHTVET
jgi:hypothetical protein